MSLRLGELKRINIDLIRIRKNNKNCFIGRHQAPGPLWIQV